MTYRELISKLQKSGNDPDYLIPPHPQVKTSIRFARRLSGNKEAEQFLVSLEKDNAGKGILENLCALFLLMATKGSIANKERFKKLRNAGGIHEFRAKNRRLYCYVDEKPNGKKEVVLTHGCKKQPKRKRETLEVERAQRIKEEDREWHLRGGKA